MLKNVLEWLQKRASQPNPTSAIQEKAVRDRGIPDSVISPAIIEPSSTSTRSAAFTIAMSADSILRVEEVTDAEFYIGDLFRRRFGADPPTYPRHFVGFYRPSLNIYHAVGYVHYSPFEDSFLCGGLVIDDRLYRKMPSEHRRHIKGAGGIAESMLRATFARLTDAPAIWGYVGNKQSDVVTQRAGFVHTDHRYVMVVWNRDMPEVERKERLDRVIAIGPF